MSGEDLIDYISILLNKEDIRCYDSSIVKKLSELSEQDLIELSKRDLFEILKKGKK